MTMNIPTELYNNDGGNTKGYLSVILFLTYLCFLGIWVFVCSKKQPYVQKIHILMGSLLVLVFVDLICGPADQHHVKVTSNVYGWDVLIYTFKFFRLVLFHTVVVLIGSGWSFFRPCLPAIQMIVCVIAILLNVGSIVIREAYPSLTWNQGFMLVEGICYSSLLIPTYMTLLWLRKTAKAEGKDYRSCPKPKLLWTFLFLVMGYSYLWRHGVLIVETIAGCDYEWMSNACNATIEIISLVFCIVMFYLFRPVEKYVVVDVEDEVEVYPCVKGKKSQTGPQKTKNRRKRGKINPNQFSFTYPKLPEDYEW
ncbi:hypothetical protein L1887_30699 [Cichorium endivia]|nr:hypothetical protein L1887_30699 [Cichorium endivia]